MSGIARYFAEVGVNVDNSQLRKVDRYLAAIEKKFEKYGGKSSSFSLNIARFAIDQSKLNAVLGNALDVASKTVSFDISKFVVNERNMQAALARASRLVGRRMGSSSAGPTQLENHEWERRRRLTNDDWTRRRRIVQEEQKLSTDPEGSRKGRISRSEIAGAGGVAGGISRLYTPALALGLGGYGLSQLNERNQQIVSSQLTTQAVVEQAGGTQKQGVEAYDWLRKQADQTGFNYLEAAPDFNKLLSGVTGAGMSVDQGKQIFKGFSDLGRVNHIDKNAQNRVFRALSQVAGKDKLMSEELTGQLARIWPLVV